VQHATEAFDERIGALPIEESGRQALMAPRSSDPGCAASDSTLRVSAMMSAGATSTSICRASVTPHRRASAA
jgi:hypothetical protein